MTGLPDSLTIDASRRRVRLAPSDPTFFQDPYPTYRAIQEVCPVFYWEDYGHWCAASFADVDALFRDRRFGREPPDPLPVPEHTRPFFDLDRLSMLEREPPAHTRLRRLVNRAFVSRAIARLEPGIAALAHALIDRLPEDRAFDLLAGFAEPIPVRVIAELLGVPPDDAHALRDWSHRMVAMYRLDRSRAQEDAAVAATRDFSAYLVRHIALRRQSPRNDLLSLLASAGPDRLSEDEAVANAILLLNAGHEATVHAIGNAVAAILASGLDPVKLFATQESTAATVEEALRFEPPLHLFTRFALGSVAFAGTELAAGERIGLLIGAANRDPAAFPNPDRFDPSRPGVAHVAFGGGLHFCLGAPLARMELRIALPALFGRHPGLRLAERPIVSDRYHFRGYGALRVSSRGAISNGPSFPDREGGSSD